MRRLLRSLLVIAVVASLPVPSASAADQTITFEDLSPGTTVSTQYQHLGGANRGPVLGKAPGQSGTAGELPAIQAGTGHLGTQSAAGSSCGSEFCVERPIWGRFSFTKEFVRLYAGVGGGGAVLRLSVYTTTSGTSPAQSVEHTVGAGANTLFEIVRPSPDIVYFKLGQVASPADHRASIKLDDLSYDNPATTPPADFGIALSLAGIYSPTGEVGVKKGKSVTASVLVTRVNGSTGNIDYTAESLPSGVTMAPVTSSGPEVALTFKASTNAASVSADDVIVRAHPSTPSSGTQDRTLLMKLTVVGSFDIQLTGIEVTQAIQSAPLCFTPEACAQTPSLPSKPEGSPTAKVSYQGVPLVKDKKTIARVFANVKTPTGGTIKDVGITLRGFRGGKELPGSPLGAEQGTSVLEWGPNAFVSLVDRGLSTGAFAFTLPASWASGVITLKAQIHPALSFTGTTDSECELPICYQNNRFELTGIPFLSTGTIDLSPVRLIASYKESPFDFACPGELFSNAEAVAPLADGRLEYPFCSYEGMVEISDLVTVFSDTDSIREQDSEIADRLEDWVDDHPSCKRRSCTDHTIGVFNNVGFGLSRGKLTEGDEPINVTESSRPWTSVAHEIYHGWGRPHASPGCGGGADGQVAEFWFPDQQGFIQGVGLDPRPNSGGLGRYRVLAPQSLTGDTAQPMEWFDFMSYCAGEGSSWISVPGWTNTFTNLFALALLKGELSQAPQVAGADGPALQVRASVDELGVVTIRNVKPDEIGPAAPPSAAYHLVVLGSGGEVLSDTLMHAVSGHADGQGAATFLKGWGTAAGAAGVQIVQGGVVRAALGRSANTPTVKILSPKKGQRIGKKRTATLSWTASDADGDELEIRAEYSTNGGKAYRSLYVGPNTGSVKLPSELLSATRKARIRVTANDGFNETSAVSKGFRAAGRPPMIRITSPGKGQKVMADASLYLSAQALADTFDPIPDKRIRWFDGSRQIGKGKQISVSGLKPGRHRIRLEATDRQGRTSRKVVPVKILAAKPLFLTLDAPKKLSRKARSVRLRVASSLAASLLAGGKAFPVTRKVRAVTIPVKPGKQDLKLPLKLRSGGKTTKLVLHISR